MQISNTVSIVIFYLCMRSKGPSVFFGTATFADNCLSHEKNFLVISCLSTFLLENLFRVLSHNTDIFQIRFIQPRNLPGCLSWLLHGKSSMIMNFSTHYFDFHGKSWMAHGRAWPHGSSSMILTHDSSMMSHVENFVQSRKFSLIVSVFVSSVFFLSLRV